VEDDRIVSVGASDSVGHGATAVDLGDATCRPGLIDAHAHILIETTQRRYSRSASA
jgi:imidazolonepropionase-like amidohydrolase